MNGLRFDLTRLSEICRWLLVGSIVVELLAAWDSIITYFAYRTDSLELWNWSITGASAGLLGERFELIDIIYAVVVIIVAVASCIWIYRASWNARELQPDPARIRPGWAVGLFFVPLLNLWKPYEAMRQSWNSSVNGFGSIDAPAPPFMKAWWGAWLGTYVVQVYVTQMVGREPITEGQQLWHWLLLPVALCCINILCTLLFMRVIQSISAAQRDRSRGQVEIFV